MNNFTIPESVKSYFNDPKTENAVNELLHRIDGGNMPELNWKERREYNKALFMAAQVRTDYIELFFTMWEIVFDLELQIILGKENPEYNHADISDYWANDYIEMHFDLTKPDRGINTRSIYLFKKEEKMVIQLYEWSETEETIQPQTIPTGWHWETEDDDADHLESEGVDFKKFLSDPEPAIAALKQQADNLFEALKAR